MCPIDAMRKTGKTRGRRAIVPSIATTLREEAARRLGTIAPHAQPPAAGDEVTATLQDLEVQKDDLEAQNEELRTARVELEHDLARYTALFEFAPIGYAVLEPGNGTIREVNHMAAQLLRRERHRLVGVPFARFVASRDVFTFMEVVQRARSTDHAQRCELERTIGIERGLHVRLTAVELAQLQRTLIIAFEDVTERKQSEQLIAKSERRLREADRRKDDFLALLSHELRNPLAAVRSGVYILSRAPVESADAREMQGIIERQVAHLTRLVNDLLDVTRIRRGKMQMMPEWIELGELVRRTIDDHRRAFEARAIELSTDLTTESVCVWADPARMVQVLTNLLGNAEKFTKRRGKVVVSLRVENGKAVLRVRDDGVGISTRELAHVFEPFRQAPQSLGRSRGGLGLGLSMVKGIIELHHGSVQIHSGGIGLGTEVTVSLPIAVRPARAIRESKPLVIQRRRVLVIEDHADTANSLARALELLDHEVAVANDGRDGLERARSFCPDVVICDLGLPSIDGYDVARALRRDPLLRGVQLIALSGHARAEDRQRADDAGFDAHIAKPADLSKLTELLAANDVPRDAP